MALRLKLSSNRFKRAVSPILDTAVLEMLGICLSLILKQRCPGYKDSRSWLPFSCPEMPRHKKRS